MTVSQSARSWFSIAGWAVLIVLASMWITRSLHVDSDLRLFLPEPATPAERILLEELEEGPGTRMLLAALSGAEIATLAAASEQVATRLRSNALFSRVENGTLTSAPELQELIVRYRYLLSPRPGGCACEPAALRRELDARLVDLGSPAGAVAQELLLRDPTGEVQAILDSWLPAVEPQLLDGVWFSRDGTQALLLLQTVAPGFDADRQRTAIAALRSTVAEVDESLAMTLTGPGAFTVLLEESVRSDVTLLGTLAGAGSVLFLLFVLRSLRHTALGVLTLATTGVIALLGVSWLYPSVHGITLAFGFTLLGVAMDYPVHLMLHLERDTTAGTTLDHVWPTLRLSILTTCLAYLALVMTGFTGLTQLGTFTVCGLVGTAIIIRWVLPRWIEPLQARAPPDWLQAVDRAPRVVLLPALVLLASVALITFSSRPLWSNELAGLTPVPQALQDLDVELRRELGAPDLRYVLAVQAVDTQAALQRDEQLRPELQRLVSEQIIGGFDSPSRLLPSIQRQLAIRDALPDASDLNAALQAGTAGTPFREDAFAAFGEDVEASRELPPLAPESLRGTALGERLDAVLLQRSEEALALITLSDVRDPDRLAAWAREAGADVLLLDLTGTAEQLVERYRTRALIAMGAALLVIAGVMLVQLRWRAALAVVLPVIATLAATVAVLHLAGHALTLFHIVSLLLVGGLSFDYGLFFNRSEATSAHALRTRYSVMVCWVSTTGAFALLMLSATPVLQAIGGTVALGVTIGFLLALLARRPDGVENPIHAR